MFAVIKTGGKQYRVHEGLILDIEKLDAQEGEEVTFEEVLMTADGDSVEIGAPFISTKVTGRVVEQKKDDKVIIMKHKRRKRYHKMQGHRQKKTRVEIISIGGSKKETAKKAPVKKEKASV